jgi:hypothetical protein
VSMALGIHTLKPVKDAHEEEVRIDLLVDHIPNVHTCGSTIARLFPHLPPTSACTPSTLGLPPALSALHPLTTFSRYASGATPGKTFNRSRRLCRNVFLGNMPETALRTTCCQSSFFLHFHTEAA